jgi:DNA repair protein RadA
LIKKLETNKEDLKKEKPTETKTPTDIAHDIMDTEKEKVLEDLSGVGPVTAQKLRDLGYRNIIDLATARADEVAAEMKTISYSIAKGWISQAQEASLGKLKMVTATQRDIYKKKTVFYFKTGSNAFNTLLGGGIPTQAISGASGRFASGKTQVGNEIIVDCISNLFTCPKCHTKQPKLSKCPDCGTTSKQAKAVLIETEPDTFHLDRLKQICSAKKIPEPNWDDLLLCPADQIPTAKAQFLQYKVVQKALEDGENIHLVVIDSFTAKFRAGYSRSEMLPIRAREFAEHFNLIEYLTAKYNIAFYLTCQVIAPPRPDQGLAAKVKFGDSFYPVGGDTLLHSVNNWIGLTQKKVELWEATLFDSSWMPRGHAEFVLTAKGLIDGIS